MAQTLYMNDGSMEVVIGCPEDVLKRIIEERLGRDCRELYEEIVAEYAAEKEAEDDYEKIADGYYGELQDIHLAMTEVMRFFDKPRLDRKNLERRLQAITDSLSKNL